MNRNNEPDRQTLDLVSEFESMALEGKSRFFDSDEMELIIDYYLEYLNMPLLSEAIDYAERLFPDSTPIKIRRAHWHLLCNDGHKAYNMLCDLKKLEPENTDIDYSLGVVSGAIGMHEEAITHYQKAATDGFEMSRLYANVAEEYTALDNPELALTYFHKAITADDPEPLAFYHYVDFCENYDLADEELAFIAEYLSDHPYCCEAWYAQACLQHFLGLFEKAADSAEYAITIDANFYDAYAELSAIQEEMHSPAEAASTLLRVIDFVDDKAYVYRQLADIFARTANHEMQILYLNKALEDDSLDASLHAELAMAYTCIDDLPMAKKSLDDAQRLDSDDPDVLFASAVVAHLDNDAEQAHEYLDRLIDTHRATEEQCRYYTVFLFQYPDYPRLIEFCISSLKAYPLDTFYSTYLLAAYFLSGLYNRARALVPSCEPHLLSQLCPQIFSHPRFAHLLSSFSQNI